MLEHAAVVEAQNKLTSSVLEQCTSREQFKELMTELYNYPKYGCPYKRGGRSDATPGHPIIPQYKFQLSKTVVSSIAITFIFYHENCSRGSTPGTYYDWQPACALAFA